MEGLVWHEKATVTGKGRDLMFANSQRNRLDHMYVSAGIMPNDSTPLEGKTHSSA